MRKALNENPVVQIGVVGVLIVIVGFVFMMNMGGGGGGEESAPPATSSTTPTSGVTPPTAGSQTPGVTSGGAPMPTPVANEPLGPPPPPDVRRAYERGDTIVMLVIRPNGIEDRRVRRSVEELRGEPGVSVFIVPAGQIADYSHLTQGLQVSRVPALIVVSPKRLAGESPVAQLHYGYRSPESVRQAVRDAEYEGQPASYGPE